MSAKHAIKSLILHRFNTRGQEQDIQGIQDTADAARIKALANRQGWAALAKKKVENGSGSGDRRRTMADIWLVCLAFQFPSLARFYFLRDMQLRYTS